MLKLSAALFTRLASSSRCTASGKRLAWANLRDHPAKALPTCYGREKSSVSWFAAPPKATHCSCGANRHANHQCEPDCVTASTKVITVDQCAELLHCTAERVEEMMRTGEIPGLKIDRSWIFVHPDLLHFLAEKARAEAESLRMKRSPHAPLPQAKPSAPAAEYQHSSQRNRWLQACARGQKNTLSD